MSDDRPVSLAAVLDVLAMLGFDKVSHAADEMRDIPTVAPATHGGLTIPEHYEGQGTMAWVTLLLAANPVLAALYDYADAFAKGASSATVVRLRDRLIAEADKLATPPKPSPAPKSVEEMAAEMGYTKCAHPVCGGYGNNTGECASEQTIIRLYAEHTAKPPAPVEMPAPRVGMAYEDEDGDCYPVGPVKRGLTWADIDEPASITRIYWPGRTPDVIWEREVSRG